jgi:hypothetical protein
MLWGEKRLRMLENRLERRIFRPEREEVTGDMRKLQKKELNLYSSAGAVK